MSDPLPLAALRQQVLAALRGHEDATLAELEALLAQPVGPGVTHASVAVHPDAVRGGGVEVWMMIDGEGRPALANDDGLYAGGAFKLLHRLRLPTFDVAARPEPDVAELVAEWVADFFAESWFKAGGWRHAVPVTLAVKGSDETVSLTRAARDLPG